MENKFIVAIGSSAGGQIPMESFFDCAPNDHASYIILRHLPINYKSILGHILKKHSKLEIIEVENATLIESNKVYLQPSDMYMTIENDRLFLFPRYLQSLYPNRSIDIFLNSLAVAKHDQSIAVILSGGGNDGAKGAALIKEMGGMVIVQKPQSCLCNSMPLSTIETGSVDYELIPEDMPGVILKHINKGLHKNKGK